MLVLAQNVSCHGKAVCHLAKTSYDSVFDVAFNAFVDLILVKIVVHAV